MQAPTLFFDFVSGSVTVVEADESHELTAVLEHEDGIETSSGLTPAPA